MGFQTHFAFEAMRAAELAEKDEVVWQARPGVTLPLRGRVDTRQGGGVG